MTETFSQSAFTAGELSPNLLSRRDIEKFDLGMRKAVNWAVDYRGGVFVRPPLKFINYIPDDSNNVRLVPFQFNQNVGNTYILVFGDEILWFLQNGQYIAETALPISDVTFGDPAVFTSNAHGLSNGDWVNLTVDDDTPFGKYLENHAFEVQSATTNTFELKIPYSVELPYVANPTGVPDTISSSSVTHVAKIYSISTPFAHTDLDNLSFDQYRDEVYITSVDYVPRKLIRNGDTDWTLSTVNFKGNSDAPSSLTVEIGTTAGGTIFNPDTDDLEAGAVYGVTAINTAGEESYLATLTAEEELLNVTQSKGSIRLEWPLVAGARGYKVYRSIMVPQGHDITYGMELGYMGESLAPQFIDNNIVPDFTSPPLSKDNPFADGAVLSIDITAAGTDYGKDTTTISLSGGSGFEGIVLVNDEGKVIGVRVLNPGSGYEGTTATISDSGAGTGATATVTTSPSTGNNPAVSARFEQRRFYAGTNNLPMTLFGSRIGFPGNFDFRFGSSDTDPVELSLASDEVTPIYHITNTPLGILAFTQHRVFRIRGADGQIITPGSARSDPVTDDGIEKVKPLVVGDHILYVAANSTSVHSIQPSQLRNYYQVVDRSVFSDHLFDHKNKIVKWAYAATPFKQVWAIREDGTALCCSYVAEQNVYAWTPHNTRGNFKDIVVIRENGYDRIYFVVERNIPFQGSVQRRKYIECFDTVLQKPGERIHAVDCYVEPPKGYLQSSNISTTSVNEDTATLKDTTGLGKFSVVSSGDLIYIGDGVAEVTALNNDNTEATVTYLVRPTSTTFQNFNNFVQTHNSWYYLPKASRFYGHWHLGDKKIDSQGCAEVTELGFSVENDFSRSLSDTTAGRAFFGFRYDADLVTLPLKIAGAEIEDKKKGIRELTVRLRNSKGLKAAALSTGDFYPLESSPYDDYTIDQYIDSEVIDVTVESDWRDDDSIILRKDSPFRSTVLGIVPKAEISLD